MIRVKVEVEVNGSVFGWEQDIPGLKYNVDYNTAIEELNRAHEAVLRSLNAHVPTIKAKVNPNAEYRAGGVISDNS